MKGYDNESMKIRNQESYLRRRFAASTRTVREKTRAWTCAPSSTWYLSPGVPRAVGTGLAIELPPGYEAQVRPRSGLALKHAITLPNSPATIDPGYRGEIRVILLNLGQDDYTVHPGDRIAQMVIARYEAVEWEEGELSDSARGAGGFGSSGARQRQSEQQAEAGRVRRSRMGL